MTEIEGYVFAEEPVSLCPVCGTQPGKEQFPVGEDDDPKGRYSIYCGGEAPKGYPFLSHFMEVSADCPHAADEKWNEIAAAISQGSAS